MSYHEPVLLQESMVGMAINPNGIYVDATFGGGGHSQEILKNLTHGKLFSFDQDADAASNVINDNRFMFIHQNFKYAKKFLRFYDALPVDGLLVDLGISSHQIDTAERGFSIRYDAELDMRMSNHAELTAKEIINTFSQEELQKIFSEYGEIQNAKILAATIISNRTNKSIDTILQFKNTIQRCVIRGKENQYYAQVFQALRIAVNDELNALKELLLQSKKILVTGGRLVVISYHSLEDRLVKNFIAKGKFEGEIEKDFYGNLVGVPFRAINKKPIVPCDEEIKKNPRARSAKMRIAEKVN